MSRFGRKLQVTSDEWVRTGIITAEQRNQIVARHSNEPGTGFAGVLGLVGGLVLAAGVGLLIGAHWDQLSDWMKITGLVALLLTSYAVGWRLRVYPGKSRRVGDALLMLGCILFMGGIALVSQIFHLNARPATGVLIWWLGIALIPLLTRSKAAQVVAVAAELIWLGSEFSTHGSWLELVPHAAFAGSVTPYLAAFTLLALSLVMNSYGLKDGRWECFAELHAYMGLVLTCVPLYVLSFAWSRYDVWQHEPAVAFRPILVILGIVALNLVFGISADREKLKPLLRGLFAAGVVPAAWLFLSHVDGASWWLGMGASVGLFALNLVMIQQGLQEGRAGWVNLGMSFIALNIFGRYVVLFGTMLQGGLFLAVTGALVLGVGWWLEHKRRALLTTLKRGAV